MDYEQNICEHYMFMYLFHFNLLLIHVYISDIDTADVDKNSSEPLKQVQSIIDIDMKVKFQY